MKVVITYLKLEERLFFILRINNVETIFGRNNFPDAAQSGSKFFGYLWRIIGIDSENVGKFFT